ncbi:hypothetical protein RN001_015149 [Aquatica leii]|uniref:Retrotransposon gag domain-containing protein n=1 Tax=Aquatica leii TaxID=1421715 RepID=A0AAN7SNE6_9COLE|nr:hypothetical protein RN001_015149 [Aquatica leii]
MDDETRGGNGKKERHASYYDDDNTGRTTYPANIGRPATSSFSKCTVRHQGGDYVLEFTNAVQIYKDCKHISEQIALMGLPMFLEKAVTWWKSIKNTITTWDEVMDTLRKAFGSTKAPYQVLNEIFATEQNDFTLTERFICEKLALLVELQEDRRMPEPLQLDTRYCLLHRCIKKKLAKTQFNWKL